MQVQIHLTKRTNCLLQIDQQFTHHTKLHKHAKLQVESSISGNCQVGSGFSFVSFANLREDIKTSFEKKMERNTVKLYMLIKKLSSKLELLTFSLHFFYILRICFALATI